MTKPLLLKQGACVIIRSTILGHVLACTRRNSELIGLPGGSVDPGETPIEAAVREVFEETGLEILPENLQLTYVDMETDKFGSFQVFCYTHKTPMHFDDCSIPWEVEPGIKVMTASQSKLIDKNTAAFATYNKRALEIADKFFP